MPRDVEPIMLPGKPVTAHWKSRMITNSSVASLHRPAAHQKNGWLPLAYTGFKGETLQEIWIQRCLQLGLYDCYNPQKDP